MGKKNYRVLSDQDIDGINYKANNVIRLDEKAGEQYSALDGDAAAVKYCIDELGSKPIDHSEVKSVEISGDSDVSESSDGQTKKNQPSAPGNDLKAGGESNNTGNK